MVNFEAKCRQMTTNLFVLKKETEKIDMKLLRHFLPN